MSGTTRLADALSSLSPQLQARLERDCERHPGHRAGDCPQCESDRDATQDGDQAAVLAEAEQARDRFPRRFRHAATDHPGLLEWVRQFHGDPQATPGLLLMGPTGTGKTHAGYGLIAEAVKVVWTNRVGVMRLPGWRALTHADLCAALRPRGRDYDPEAELERLRRYDLLMVDDFGTAKITEFVEEATYRLVNARYEDMRPTIFTSNLAPDELREAVGDRIASRLVESCTRVVLDGPDRRRAQAVA